MDIGIVQPELIYPRGAEKQACKFSYYLDKMGHDVTLYTFEKKEDYVFDPLLKNIEIVSLNEKWISGPYSFSYNLLKWRRLIKEISKKVKKHDVINAHNHPAQWISKYTDIPTVWTCNEPYMYNVNKNLEKLYFFRYSLDKHLSSNIKLILTLNRGMEELIRNRYQGINVQTTGSGVDLERKIKHVDNDYFDAVFVGPIQPQKHPFDIIKAFSLIDNEIPNSRLHFVGYTTSFISKRLKNEMIKYAEKKEVETIFHGSISNEKLYDLYDIADISVFVPEAEPWGIFPLETISGGIPTIISDQCGINDILPYHHLTIETGDIKQLADKILEIKENYKEYKNKTSEISRMISEKYSWEACSKRMEKILFEVKNSH